MKKKERNYNKTQEKTDKKRNTVTERETEQNTLYIKAQPKI